MCCSDNCFFLCFPAAVFCIHPVFVVNSADEPGGGLVPQGGVHFGGGDPAAARVPPEERGGHLHQEDGGVRQQVRCVVCTVMRCGAVRCAVHLLEPHALPRSAPPPSRRNRRTFSPREMAVSDKFTGWNLAAPCRPSQVAAVGAPNRNPALPARRLGARRGHDVEEERRQGAGSSSLAIVARLCPPPPSPRQGLRGGLYCKVRSRTMHVVPCHTLFSTFCSVLESRLRLRSFWIDL